MSIFFLFPSSLVYHNSCINVQTGEEARNLKAGPICPINLGQM